ncbi:segregation and condensation protein A [Pararhizobium mangrovi]|uniref:Segregation and condensation protein A n=1 Tax=Pararhizobium mangrovi TaxID=2590452 RepID=A0A506U6U3_9HYPH|nr:ScpA family protein [Pararhizobium mangrovi]TPW29570.1 segregation/condensation protein A [Pararhizobium mangrovi]
MTGARSGARQIGEPADWPANDDAGPTASEPALVVDVDGFEGPLDLLLHLARRQKVDLSRISILALAQQYLTFIEDARRIRLELAADYLVMAAWLAYLKSRLLLPQPDADEEESGEELAARLAFRLKRLEAMRDVAARLVGRDRLGRDIFARGNPEATVVERSETFTASLYDLLTAYAAQRRRQTVSRVRIARRPVWSLADARSILARMIGEVPEWTPLEQFLAPYLGATGNVVTARASTFAACLELVREGRLEVRQDAAFAPLHLRDVDGNTGMADGERATENGL